MNKMKTKKQNREFILSPDGYWYANPNFTPQISLFELQNSQQTKQNTSLRRKGDGYIKSDKTADTNHKPEGKYPIVQSVDDTSGSPSGENTSFEEEKQELFQGGFRCGMVEGELKGAEATKKDVLKFVKENYKLDPQGLYYKILDRLEEKEGGK